MYLMNQFSSNFARKSICKRQSIFKYFYPTLSIRLLIRRRLQEQNVLFTQSIQTTYQTNQFSSNFARKLICKQQFAFKYFYPTLPVRLLIRRTSGAKCSFYVIYSNYVSNEPIFLQILLAS